jgi:hypothetical protein
MASTIRSVLLLLAASFLAWPGCGPKVEPEGPGTSPSATSRKPRKIKSGRIGRPEREVLVGEMCPKVARGRPAVLPLFVRRLGWSADQAAIARPLESRSARRFSVFAWDGHRAGWFSVVGVADTGLDRRVAVGAYAGASPCAHKGRLGKTTDDPSCVATQSHCGLALAVMEAPGGFGSRPFNEDPELTHFKTVGACTSGGKLVVDIDADGNPEAFPLAGFVDPVRAPAEEVVAVAPPAKKCKPSFSIYRALPETNPRHWRGLDILGVVDMDGDGRMELVASYHYSDRRTWAIYSAPRTAGRLELMGEAVPWPRP